MKLCLASLITALLSFFKAVSAFASIKGSNNPVPYYLSDVAINCGYLGNSTAHDGRQWFGDTGSKSIISMLQPKGKSTSSRIVDQGSLSADPIPYMTARVFATQFYYTFQINSGQKFIRLHFYPSSYVGFEKSQDFFSVEAGSFTLLRNFSASIVADALGVRSFVKEFCLNVGEGKYLNITFSPSRSTKKRKLYAFVNGIEIISMPPGLYYTPDGDLGVPVVGQNSRYIVDNTSALEMVQRLNIGGSHISPVEDFGLFRRWTEDANYLVESNLRSQNNLVSGIKYGGIPVSTVSPKIYHASWKTDDKYGRADKMHTFSWKIPVDLGFGYLVRLYFCDFSLEVTKGELRDFNVIMNNQIAETNANVVRLSGGTGVPMYRDYVVILKGDKNEGKFDLLITLQSFDELVVGLLHGLEIFKLSSLDNNLANANPIPARQVSTSTNLKIQNLLLACVKIPALEKSMIILIILNVIVFKLKKIWEETCHEEQDNLSISTEQSFHRFSLSEIISATQNFSDAFFVGRGGFGNVYKGFICGGSKIVAVKRLKSNSKQGAQEFWTEIETLSKIRHIHLVSLIGYCNEYDEMILVYEYMPRGTLADNLYKISRNEMNGTTLTWEQRLRVCIGAARGLDYLHTGIEHGIVHRDVKDSNILLDGNLTAKISDFGLSKLEKVSESQCYISTKVKGTVGYLDPDYLITQKLTRKSDVYSFGIVMLVVLCGKPAVDRSIPGETQTLLSSFRELNEKGEIENIIDPNLGGPIPSEGLSEYVTCIQSCLHHEPKKRPTMTQVAARLERLLERQQVMLPSTSDGVIPACQPCEVENVQPSQFHRYTASPMSDESATVISPAEEETGSESIIDNAEVKSKEVSSSGGKDRTSIQKPSWIRPWEALRNRGKPMKKNDLVQAPIRQIPQSESQILLSSKLENFSYHELKATTKNFGSDALVEEGFFGSVFMGWIDEQSLRPSKPGIGMAVAVKRLNERTELLAKINDLGRLQHPNLVKLIGYCFEDSPALLVYEFMPMGSLELLLFSSDRASDLHPLSWSIRTKIAVGAARGLAFLHGVDLIYRKFSIPNILLDANYNAKLSNVGLARQVEPIDDILSTKGDCNHGMCDAPEYLLTGNITAKSEVYSFGVVLLEIFAGRRARDMTRPRNERNLVEWAKPYLTEKRKILRVFDARTGVQYPLVRALKLAKLVLWCLSVDPIARPTMDEVVRELEELEDSRDKTVDIGTAELTSKRYRDNSSHIRDSRIDTIMEEDAFLYPR